MSWALTALLSVLLVEAARRLPFPAVLARAARTGGKALRVVRAGAVSDHWKEKALLAYAGTMLGCSLRLAGLLLLLAVAALPAVALLDRLDPGLAAFVTGWPGLALGLACASLWLALRSTLRHAGLLAPRPAAASARADLEADRRAQL